MRWPRPEPCARWAFTITPAVLAAWWLISGWYVVAFATKEHRVSVFAGIFTYEAGPIRPGDRTGLDAWLVINYPGAQRWRWTFYHRRGGNIVNAHLASGPIQFVRPARVEIPLWPAITALGLAATGFWLAELRRRTARRDTARCITCKYDRRGLPPDAKCPECGATPE